MACKHQVWCMHIPDSIESWKQIPNVDIKMLDIKLVINIRNQRLHVVEATKKWVQAVIYMWLLYDKDNFDPDTALVIECTVD